MTDLTDLLARVALGDRQAYADIYSLTSPKVYALALRMLGEPGLAQDLVQDVYLKVWYAADSYSSTRGEPLTWLISITRNRALDVMRSKDFQTQSLSAEPDDSVGLDAQDEKLGGCIDRLEDQQRQSIFAAFYQGLTHSEIAQAFAEPIGTIKSRVRRGLAALRECLDS